MSNEYSQDLSLSDARQVVAWDGATNAEKLVACNVMMGSADVLDRIEAVAVARSVLAMRKSLPPITDAQVDGHFADLNAQYRTWPSLKRFASRVIDDFDRAFGPPGMTDSIALALGWIASGGTFVAYVLAT